MPNFQSVSSFGKLLKYTEMEANTVPIEYGEFIGTSENQFGTLYNFRDVKSGEKLTLPACGKLRWCYENGDLKERYRYQIVYLGKKTLDSGAYKGKEAHDIELLEDTSYAPQMTAPSMTETAPQSAPTGFDENEEIPV